MGVEQEIYSKLVEQFGIREVCIKKYGKRAQMLWLEFIYLILTVELENLPSKVGFNDRQSLSKYFIRNFPKIVENKGNRRWKNYLLNIVDHKYCPFCEEIKSTQYFSYSTKESDGLQSYCKDCTSELQTLNKDIGNARGAKRRAAKLGATPNWADHEIIKQIYETCHKGYHVDHIVPLQNDLVCGLHCEFNLQHLSAEENRSKSNKFTC